MKFTTSSLLEKLKSLSQLQKIVFGTIAIIAVLAVMGALTSNKQKPVAAHKNTNTASPSTGSSVPLYSKTYTDVSAWMQKYGYIINKIQDDGNATRDAVSASDYALLQEACGNERADVETALTFPVIPDAEAAAHMRAMLTYEHTYTDECVNGASDAQAAMINDDQVQESRAIAEINAAASSLNNAVPEIDALTARLNAIIAAR